MNKESGYLLLESLITLLLVVILIFTLYPLLADWLALRQNEKDRVEQNRILYEYSYIWEGRNEGDSTREGTYEVYFDDSTLKVTGEKEEVGVTFYEAEFE